MYWSYSCKIKISASESEEGVFLADIILIDEEGEKIDDWELPYKMPLEYTS